MIRILGVDASSTSCGVSIIEDGIPVQADVHISNKKKTLEVRLQQFGLFLNAFRAKRKLDAIGIERVGKQRNLNTVRMLAYFEAIAILKGAEWKVPVHQYSVPTIRKHSMGSGKATKEQVYDKFAKIISLRPYDKYGNDESDSIAAGVACWELEYAGS